RRLPYAASKPVRASKHTWIITVVVELRANAHLRSGSRSHRLVAGAGTREAGAHGLVRRPRPGARPARPAKEKHDTHSRSECAEPLGGSSCSPGLPFDRQRLSISL